ARVRASERGLHRGHLVEDLVDPDRAAAAVLLGHSYPIRDERRGRARLAPAKVAVLADDDLVERPGRERAVGLHVLVAAVAGHADDADRTAVPPGPIARPVAVHPPGEVGQ